MSFQAPFNPMGLMEARMQADLYQQQQQRAYAQDIMGSLTQLAGAYGSWKKGKDMLGAMDKGVGLMSDIGAIEPDIRDRFINLKPEEKPFVFDLLRQGMFTPYAAGQSAGFQAAAWDKYKNSGGSAPTGSFFTY